MIALNKPLTPSLVKLSKYLDQVNKNGWYTNFGPLHQELTKRLEEYLGVKNLLLVSNGTLAIQVACKALNINSAITTPFSFVATTSSLLWQGIDIAFSDIDPLSYNLCPIALDEALAKDDSYDGIVATHVYGNPCDVYGISSVASKYNKKVVYDAAHAFGVQYKGESLLNYGDISTLSFHATKIFHSIEGGALIINDDSLVEKARYLINFGIKNTEEIPELGINAKMNEFEAAMGLCVLDDMQQLDIKRKFVCELYKKELKGVVKFQQQNEDSTQNYSYFPIILESKEQLKKIEKALNEKDIIPRRYFYPSLDTLSYISAKNFCKNSRDIASKILCLPMYPELDSANQKEIIKVLKTCI